MSLLDFFRRPSPTAEWREDRSVPLVADLDLHELGGVPFGGPIDGLSFLGPSDTRFFDYASKGLTFDAEEGHLDGFVIALRSGAYLAALDPSRVHPFAGRIRIGGRAWAPLELRAESDFVQAWGEPYWRDTDEEEVLLFFEFPAAEVQVELSLDGIPRVLVATPRPLLADPSQREAYGVNGPWPPERYAGPS